MARGRRASVRYWASRKGGGYFCTMGGKQIELALGPDDFPDGETYLRALSEFARINRVSAHSDKSGILVSDLMLAYKAHLQERDAQPRSDAHGTSWMHRYRARIEPFLSRYGERLASSITQQDFDDWWRAEPGWGPTTCASSTAMVRCAYSWAAKTRLIPANYLRGQVTAPVALVRGKEARLSADLCRLLVESACSASFRLFVRALHATGCRPVELRSAQAVHYRQGSIVFPWNARPGEYKHKTARTRRDRVIYLPPELDSEVARLAAARPTGRLFQTPRLAVWSPTNICTHWRRLLRVDAVASYLADHKLNPALITPYCFRHTWISDWVGSGRSIHLCARLAGTSVKMIERVYGHPDHALMHAAYLDFMSAR